MSSHNRDKILKSWAGVSENQLIKEVATKGEHITLCLEYLAKKRKISVTEYESIFHDVVQAYVERLLSEHLVCKSENVLRNVQRDVWACFYQFICECEDVGLGELVLEHLRKKDPTDFVKKTDELQFNYQLLLQMQLCPGIQAKYKEKLRRIDLETLLTCGNDIRKRLIVELYFENRNITLLEHLSRHTLWKFFVETSKTKELISWCHLNNNGGGSETVDAQECCTDLELKYMQWPIEQEMFEFAIKTLPQPVDEVLRNCFATGGYFFADERDNVTTVLHRICMTESFNKNSETLEKLPIGRHLLERNYNMLMLHKFVGNRELDELTETYPEKEELLKFLVTLKENDLLERQGFEKISNVCKSYLENSGVDFQNEQPLVTFYEFLCNEPTVPSLQCFLLSSALKRVPYLKSLKHRLEPNSSGSNGSGNGRSAIAGSRNLPTPYDFLRKFKKIDFKEICKDSHEVPSFSNERLCQKYSRKYNLNFLHYLKQQRSSYAAYYLLLAHLQNYAQLTKAQLFRACESVTELALQNINNADLITHCVAFEEMLGFDTQYLRIFLKLCRTLDATDCCVVPNFSSLITQMERGLAQHLTETFPLAEFQALIYIVGCNQQRQWPLLIMQKYAKDDDWWRLLVLLQYFDIPLQQIRQLVEHFETRIMGEHLLRALAHEPSSMTTAGKRHKKRRSTEQPHLPTTTSIETLTSSVSSCADANNLLLQSTTDGNGEQLRFLPDNSTGNIDLFSILLLSTTTSIIPEEHISGATKFLEFMQDNLQYSMSWNLLKNAVKYRLPILAVLSATVSNMNIDWNWIVWLAVTIDEWQQIVQIALQNIHELSWQLIENAVRKGCITALYRSFAIFYVNNPLMHLLTFLQRTQQLQDFGDESVHELRLYLLAWSNDEVRLPPLSAPMQREQLMLRSIKLLLLHLQNFSSTLEQYKFLNCICRSDMSDISGLIDFCLLKEVFGLLQTVTSWTKRFPFDFEQLLHANRKEYEQLLTALRDAKEYDAAVRLASLLHLPICDIVYSKWVAALDACDNGAVHDLNFEDYEAEIHEHSLPPEVLVNFFLYVASRIEDGGMHERKYLLLKHALSVIKKNHLFPNESFDRDQIEYKMIVSYLLIDDDNIADKLEIYHSEYYEQIMLRERCVLYKSFLELKELAGIEELSITSKSALNEMMKMRLESLLNRLLDEGDIVEALRLQELFECRPIDLRFVVFCMALAEGVTTIFSMSPEERQFLRDIEKSSFAKFNRRTLNNMLNSPNQQQQQQMGNNNASSNTSDSGILNNELSDSCSTLEFEEIPSKEKRETLDTIQGIASKLKYGHQLGKRIVMVYRAAMYMDKEYLDVLRTKDVSLLLKRAAEEECMQRLLVVSDILSSTHMTAQEIADLLALEITTAVVRPRFYIFSADHHLTKHAIKNAHLWGYNIDRDLHLFLELVPNTTLLGNTLLEYCDALKIYRKYQDNKPYEPNVVFEKLADIIKCYGLPTCETAGPNITTTTAAAVAAASPQVLSHKKQNLIYVELLIKAHQCFVHECSMEGIANILNRSKVLNSVLTKAKSWTLIVRMLMGIGHYREMFYCFDALIENEQFESLLGQFDNEKTIGLRQAILAYLREYAPQNAREFLKLAALHFLMYKDLAEIWEQDAQALLNKLPTITAQQATTSGIQVPSAKKHISRIKCSTEAIVVLRQALENYTHATENYLLDNKLLLAQKSASLAEMVAMQIDLASKGQQLCVRVINVQTREEFRDLINTELSVPQALILSRACSYDINWSEALLYQYVVLQRNTYLSEYLAHLPLNDVDIENVVKAFQLYTQTQRPTMSMEENLSYLVQLVKSVPLKYKLASLLALKGTVMTLINDQTSYYLKDTNYGRNENYSMHNI